MRIVAEHWLSIRRLCALQQQLCYSLSLHAVLILRCCGLAVPILSCCTLADAVQQHAKSNNACNTHGWRQQNMSVSAAAATTCMHKRLYTKFVSAVVVNTCIGVQ